MSGWTPEQLAGLNREAERKQLMDNDGVDPGEPVAREAWEAEFVREDTCRYCGKSIRLNTAAPEDSDLSAWRDDWDDAECDSHDGEHHPQNEEPGVAEDVISHAEVRQILAEVREEYARFGRGDDDIFRVLENRMAPLTPGEPVQFQKGFQHRWLNGVFGGPVDNPDDPQREGDFWVLATASGRHVPVFLSSVRRRGAI